MTAAVPQPPAPAGTGVVNLVAQRLTHQGPSVSALQQGQRVMALYSAAPTGPQHATQQNRQYAPTYPP